MIQSLILGVVQGLCEFLPVSSSGHLALFQIFMGFEDNMMSFDILLHFATLLAVLIYFRREIWRVLFDWKYILALFIATVITAAIGFSLKSTAESFSENLKLVGTGEIFTGLVLISIPIFASKRVSSSLLMTAIVVGIAQGIAVLPGVSRSGMSIAAGILMGLSVYEAFKFSFLLSIPAIAGATLLECLKFMKSGEAVFMPEGYFGAAIVSFALGLLTLDFMRRLVNEKNWAYFGVYCLLIGITALVI